MTDRVWLRSDTRVVTARMAGDSPAMDAAARGVLRAVKTIAAQHVDTGHYIGKLGIVTVPGLRGTGRTVKDRLVVADDEGAAAIEFGRIYRFANSRRVRWEPGKHIMARGAGLAKGML